VVTTGGDDVPKIPFAKGLRLSWREVLRIATVCVMLVVVITMREPCSDAVSQFVTGFDGSGADPAAEMPKPGTVSEPEPSHLVRIAPTATPAEQKSAVEQEKARP
jgi:hypothetical protein